MPRDQVKSNARSLRKRGLSYAEISRKISVPESTVWGWVKEIKLTNKQKLRLKRKSARNRRLGSQALLNSRLARTVSIIESARSEVHDLGLKDLWLIGIILYWTEGSKQKDHYPSKEVIFSNSDPRMVKVFIKWLEECLEIPKDRVLFEIYIHETYKRRIEELKSYWSQVTRYEIDKFPKIYFKRNKVHSYRKNRGPNYHGVLRISIRRSTDLNRKITGWIEGVCGEILR